VGARSAALGKKGNSLTLKEKKSLGEGKENIQNRVKREAMFERKSTLIYRGRHQF